MHALLHCLLFAVLITPLAAAPTAVHLAPGVPLLVPAGTSGPVRMAVEDLQRDLVKVFGAPSPIVNDVAELRGRPAIIILGPGEKLSESHDAKILGREAHGIHVSEING